MYTQHLLGDLGRWVWGNPVHKMRVDLSLAFCWCMARRLRIFRRCYGSIFENRGNGEGYQAFIYSISSVGAQYGDDIFISCLVN
jgi:hypothetical protein